MLVRGVPGAVAAKKKRHVAAKKKRPQTNSRQLAIANMRVTYLCWFVECKPPWLVAYFEPLPLDVASWRCHLPCCQVQFSHSPDLGAAAAAESQFWDHHASADQD